MKNTDNLRQDLMNAADLDSFLSDNRDNFNGDSVGELLSRLYLRKNISKASQPNVRIRINGQRPSESIKSEPFGARKVTNVTK